MEFKDKLKTIRKEKGLSQQALADAIFVSRSAVAKWENGLGYPNSTSYQALVEYFQVEENYFDTEEVQEVVIAKNRKIYILRNTLCAIAVALILIFSFVFVYLFTFVGYGFTTEMAIGDVEGYECIELEDYDIYWRTITEPEEMACIDLFTPVKKTFIGCFIREEDKQYKEVFCNGNRVAILYSIEGKDGYYNILKKGHTVVGYEDGVGETSFFSALSIVDNIQINNEDIEVKYNSFFITEDEVTEFSIGEYNFVVDDEEYSE